MEREFELIAKTFQGLEDVLAHELKEIGANNVVTGRRVVSFTGTRETMYRANYALRTAIRVLKPLLHFKATTADEVYDAIKKFDWESVLSLKTTFAVDAVVYSENFRYSKFVAYKVKDAIVDYFREKEGQRPNISVANPGIRFHIHISDDDCTLSLDSSGESLHMRGYRAAKVDAPINEALAAGLVMLTGWNGDCDFIDPMCGSGTIAIEACMLARGIAPGRLRKEYAFEKWPDYDAALFEAVKEEYGAGRPFEHKIYASDINPQAVAATRTNVKTAGLSENFTISCGDFRDFAQPAEKAVMVMNPPYGVRTPSQSILELYRTIGECLKHQFVGGTAWIISNHEECFDCIGLKPSLKIPLYNGSIDCQFQKYRIFAGRLDKFRRGGEELKSDEERKYMADKHRFKENRDFKKKPAAETERNYGDMPEYIVRNHLAFEARMKERELREKRRYNGRGYDNSDARSSWGRGGRFERPGDNFNREGGRFERRRDGFSSYGNRAKRDGDSSDRKGWRSGRDGYSGKNHSSGRSGYSRGDGAGRRDRNWRNGFSDGFKRKHYD